MDKRKGLGKGISSLMGDIAQPMERGTLQVAIDLIVANPDQPRKSFSQAAIDELAQSIRTVGIIQPLIVAKAEKGYRLIAGERRLRAAKVAGLTAVPVVVREEDEMTRSAMALIENLQREDLNPLEEAMAYAHLKDTYGLKQEEIARHVGRSRSYVANMLRLLQLPAALHDYLRDGTLTTGQLRPLLALKNTQEQERWADRIVKEGWNARDIEQAMAQTKDKKKARRVNQAERHRLTYFDQVKEALTLHMGTPVAIYPKSHGEGGRVEIRFHDVDELARLVEQMGVTMDEFME